ncbi:MAG: hypothetical protein PVJ39_03180 [Gammaproteobacteria bacterium]
MDTLSALSSAFTKATRHDRQADSLRNLVIDLDDTAQRAFNEFATGMRMLHKHSSHNSFNVFEISSQNLKLLNANLKTNADYRKTVSRIRSRAIASPQWCRIELLANDALDAGLLYIPAGQSLIMGDQGALTIRDNALHAPFALSGEPVHNRRLYLNLAGKPIFEYQKPISIHTMNRYIRTSTQQSESRCLRHKEAFTEEQGRYEVQRINAGQETCLLLNINLLQD